MPSLGVCLTLVGALAAPVPATVFVETREFTLAWTHSIEKVRWEEDYRVDLDPATGQPRLNAVAARIKGSAAGMEPPPDAVLRRGWYRYAPVMPYPPELRLTRSEFTPDYEVCVPGRCRAMADWMASDGGVTLLEACSR